MTPPPLLARLLDLERRLAVPVATKTLAAAMAGLLALQVGVVVERSRSGDGLEGVAIAEAPSASPSDTPPPLSPPAPEASTPAPAAPDLATTIAPGEHATTDPATATAPSTEAPLVQIDPGGDEPGQAPPRRTAAGGTSEPASSASSEPAPPSERPSPAPSRTTEPAPERTSEPARDTRTASQRRFDARYPSHAAATEDVRQPATTRWAVIIGINEHSGRTRDNVGSRQDAEDLAAHLRSLGWRDDHVLLVTDTAATRETILEAMSWLARKTTPDSVAVFHYSGHTKQWPGQDVDGDGERTDEALWPTDNRFITDAEVVAKLSKVRASRLWVDIGACEAAGFADPGLAGPGRLLTFSSKEDEKSYEDPSVGNSVWGYYLVEQGLRAGQADANGDGQVTVEEAFRFAAPRAAERTRGQRKGQQTPVVIDGIDGELSLRIPPPPPAPRPSREPSPEPTCGLICPPATRSRADAS